MQANRSFFLQFNRFLVSGTVNTALSYAVYLVLLRVTSYELAYIASYILGLGFGYYLNSRWVFSQEGSALKLALYPLVYLPQLVFGTLLLNFIVEKLGLPPSFSVVCVIILTIPLNFLLVRWVMHQNLSPHTLWLWFQSCAARLRKSFGKLDMTIGSTATVMQSGAPWLSRWFRPELAVLMTLFLLLYFFKLANYSLQIDDEVAALRTSSEIWLTQGRWGAYLFETWILPNPAIPFLATFLFGLFISIGYLVLLDAHGVKHPGMLHYATFPIFVAFPTWIYLVAFAANSGAAGLGTMFSCFAALAYSRFIATRHADGSPVSWALLGCAVLAIALATGMYQTFIFVAAVLGLGVLLAVSLRNHLPCRALIVDALFLLAILLAGVVLYRLINELFMRLHGVVLDSGYLGRFLNIHLFLNDPLAMLNAAFDAMRKTYFGDINYYGVRASGFPALITFGAIAMVIVRAPISRSQRTFNIALGCVLLVAPFVMHALSGRMPVRSVVAAPFVFWLFTMIGLTCGRRWLEFLTSAALVLSLYGIFHAANTMQAVDTYVRAHDRHLAADLYRRIAEVNPEFDTAKPIVIDIHGAKHFSASLPRTFSSTWGFSFFEWDGGNPYYRMLPYMHLQGYTNLRLATNAQREGNLQHFRDMPSWPAAGSVRIVDGVTLIKLGNVAGYPFNLRH